MKSRVHEAMIKTLGLALYGPLAASTRYRLGQFKPGLSALGIELEIRSLLDDNYLRRTFEGQTASVSGVLSNYLNRLRHLRNQDQFDVTILHVELLPFVPAFVEQWILRRPYIYDLDDAFYLRYRLGPKRVLHPFLGRKFDRVIESAAAVTAGNASLASYCRNFNQQVFGLPTVVDVKRYQPSSQWKHTTFTVGWIGSPSTATYLESLTQALSKLGEEGPVAFLVVGGKAPSIPHVQVVEVPWSEHDEVRLINSFDVGVMPLPDDEWARGKCAFKLIQYMACAVPVIASAVGANVDVVTPASGFLARSPDEWLSSLRTLRDSRKLREEMGAAGRERIVEQYSLHTALPKLAEVIRRVAAC